MCSLLFTKKMQLLFCSQINQSINQSINQCLFAPLIQKINLQKAQSSQKPLMFLQEGPLTKHCFPKTGRWLNKIWLEIFWEWLPDKSVKTWQFREAIWDMINEFKCQISTLNWWCVARRFFGMGNDNDFSTANMIKLTYIVVNSLFSKQIESKKYNRYRGLFTRATILIHPCKRLVLTSTRRWRKSLRKCSTVLTKWKKNKYIHK